MPTPSNARAVIGTAVLTLMLAAGCADKPAASSSTTPPGKSTVTTVAESPTGHGIAPAPTTAPLTPSATGSTWISAQPPGQKI